MAKKLEPQIGLRFRSQSQRELIRRAARKIDISMNSFIRGAAEERARLILKPPPVEETSLAQS